MHGGVIRTMTMSVTKPGTEHGAVNTRRFAIIWVVSLADRAFLGRTTPSMTNKGVTPGMTHGVKRTRLLAEMMGVERRFAENLQKLIHTPTKFPAMHGIRDGK